MTINKSHVERCRSWRRLYQWCWCGGCCFDFTLWFPSDAANNNNEEKLIKSINRCAWDHLPLIYSVWFVCVCFFSRFEFDIRSFYVFSNSQFVAVVCGGVNNKIRMHLNWCGRFSIAEKQRQCSYGNRSHQ